MVYVVMAPATRNNILCYTENNCPVYSLCVQEATRQDLGQCWNHQHLVGSHAPLLSGRHVPVSQVPAWHLVGCWVMMDTSLVSDLMVL
jgi:hypothetical protein